MRLSTSAVLALPLLAAAQGPLEQFEQYKAQFQNFLSNFGAKATTEAPSAKTHPVQAAEAAIGATQVDVLTLSNWKDTLYGPVKADSTTPTEWWVLISGGNKTCFGRRLTTTTPSDYVNAVLTTFPLQAIARRLRRPSTHLLLGSPCCPRRLIWHSSTAMTSPFSATAGLPAAERSGPSTWCLLLHPSRSTASA